MLIPRQGSQVVEYTLHVQFIWFCFLCKNISNADVTNKNAVHHQLKCN